MPLSQALILNSIIPALEGAAALFLALCLCSFHPFKYLKWYIPMAVVLSSFCGLFRAMNVSVFLILVPSLLLIPAVKYLFSSSWMYGAVTGFLYGILYSLSLLFFSLSVPDIIVLAITVLLCGLCCWKTIALLPQLSEIPVISDKKQSWRFISSLLLSIFCLLILLLLLCTTISQFSSFSWKMRIWMVSLALGCSVILLLSVRRLAFGAIERIEALIDKQYQGELLNFMHIIRSQRHDFNFHMQAVAGMIEGQRYQECQEYIQQMVKNTTAMNEVLPLHDPAVSAMLNSFQEIALQKQIRFDLDIHNDLQRFPCSIYETNTIIGNLIQNAIDEVEHYRNNRWIRLLILKRGGDIILKVTNPCSRPPEEFKKVFAPGYSTKQSHEGIGLTTVSRFTARYSGSVHPEFDHGTISFIVRIPAQHIIE